MIEYKSRGGATQFKPQLGVDIDESDIDDNIGWCLACGAQEDGVEPDACKLRCSCCDKPKVYGLSELALMGLLA